MVKVEYCDRCGKETSRGDKVDFNNFFEGFEKDASISIKMGKNDIKKDILRPQLCQKCLEGYNSIIDRTNLEVKKFLEEGKK